MAAVMVRPERATAALMAVATAAVMAVVMAAVMAAVMERPAWHRWEPSVRPMEGVMAPPQEACRAATAIRTASTDPSVVPAVAKPDSEADSGAESEADTEVVRRTDIPCLGAMPRKRRLRLP